jgi:transcriptional repressor NrdR
MPMKCPKCGYFDSKVIDSRPSTDGSSIRRRRECLECQGRFTTFETIEETQIVVIKKNGEKELFDRNKLLSGIIKSCYKRPVDADAIANEIEQELHNTMRNDITTKEIGELVMMKLKECDHVAYVRFASVYREFKDVDTFLKEIKELMKKR